MKFKFALVNGERIEAQPGLRGTCAFCQSDTIAKCGPERIWHWAHKSKASCDLCWENQTKWHMAWKNYFPGEWQESIHIDSTTKEKHIADIKTDKGFVIEFQYSAIKPSEIQSREAFYKNMVWVVNGSRLKRDYPRFCKGARNFMYTRKREFFLLNFPERSFPAGWLTSSVPVYFDFQGTTPLDQSDEMHAPLWCLFPGRVDGYAIVAMVSRKQFREFSLTAPNLLLAQDSLSYIAPFIAWDIQHQSAIVAQRVPLPAPNRQYINAGCRRYMR
ncbi:MAG: competence protein CoiA family protein [Candidatus Omnitrophica bacterium]|nr:competence protein CoiA family protein [Candidatus Omnitrophota bacterium]